MENKITLSRLLFDSVTLEKLHKTTPLSLDQAVIDIEYTSSSYVPHSLVIKSTILTWIRQSIIVEQPASSLELIIIVDPPAFSRRVISLILFFFKGPRSASQSKAKKGKQNWKILFR